MLFAGTMRCTCTAKVILLCGKNTCLFNLIVCSDKVCDLLTFSQRLHLCRIALSDNKYQVIKLPAGIEASVYDQMYLGKSEKGVYSAVVENQDYRLQVLFLDESGGRMEWVFKYDINLRTER